MSQRFELEQLYFQAKELYYSGNPIMSDDEFDKLEAELKTMGSGAPFIVGADDRKAKYSHPTPMLSLAKYQASLNGNPPTESAQNWMNKIGKHSFEITPKYDGNAANAIYQDGKLLQVLTRGNGTKGRDITDKVKHNLPDIIGILGTVEIRGEVVIKVSTFNHKYSEFKNPRNYVAGVLNRDENSDTVIADLDFIPLEVRVHSDEGILFVNPNLSGFKQHSYSFYIGGFPGQFEDAYKTMEDYRINHCEYQLDGFVIKAPNDLRPILGENSHDPNWAVAIKFPPKEAITKIKSISWQYGKTGELTPVAVMEPVNLDGSTVSRAALFNLGYLKEKRAYPGAMVAIAKSGDIIPQITRMITPGNETEFMHPTVCKCGAPTVIESIHLYCSNDDCETKAWHKFYIGTCFLGIDGMGSALAKQFWNAGFRSPLEFLNTEKMEKKTLLNAGLKDGKILDNVLQEIKKIEELRPMDIVMLMGVDGMGYTTAKQIGNYISGLPYTFSGLEKTVIAGFEIGGDKRLRYEALTESVKHYVNIVLPEQISASSIPFEMSGSPKSGGFKTKDEFIKFAKSKGYHHTSLSSAKVLFVEDINNLSNKIKAAQSKGVKIMLYTQI